MLPPIINHYLNHNLSYHWNRIQNAIQRVPLNIVDKRLISIKSLMKRMLKVCQMQRWRWGKMQRWRWGKM